MENHEPSRTRLRIDPSDLALEIVSIVIAIVLATGVGQLVERYRDAGRTHAALLEIRQEIATDRVVLGERRPVHRRLYDAYSRTVTRAQNQQLDFDGFRRTFRAAAPRGLQPFDGTTTAWDLARSSSVLGDVPYRLRAALQTRYDELTLLRSVNASVIGHLESAPFDRHPNYFFTANSLALLLSDVVFSEQRLVQDDDAALQGLSDAGVR